MRGFFDDCRHALRLYRRTPGASTIAVVVLAVGIAFVGAFLSLYVDLVLRPHPGFEQSGRLVTIGRDTGDFITGFTHEINARLSDEMASVDAAAYWLGAETLVGADRERVMAALASAEFFPGLRPRIALGRGLQAADHVPEAEPVVVLSYLYWLERFGGNPDVLGTTVEIAIDPDGFSYRLYRGPPGSPIFERFEPEQDSAQFRIVGVMAPDMADLRTYQELSNPPVWLPLERAWPFFAGVPASLPGTWTGAIYARRAPGASVTAVATELRARYGNLDSAGTPSRGIPDAVDGIVINTHAHRDAKRQLEMFLAGSVLLALAAAANVSLFLLARAPGRRRELAIRLAVGAPVRRIARQLAVEASLIVAAAGVLGLIGSIWLGLYIRGLALLRDALFRNVTLFDWRVLALAGASLLVLALLVSLAPVLGLKRGRIAASSRLATARASLAQRVAGTAQIAAAGAFAAAAIALGWHISLIVFGDPGFAVRDRLVVDFSRFAPAAPPSDLSEAGLRAFSVVEDARRIAVMETVPGVERAAFGEPVPGHDSFVCPPIQVPDPVDPARSIEVCRGGADREFVEVLGLRILHGRLLERYERGTVLVNQTLARILFGRDDVVGERFPVVKYYTPEGAEIVGVLEDVSFEHPTAAARPYVFMASGGLTAIVEGRLTPAALQQGLERNIADGGIDAQFGLVQTLTVLRSDMTAPDRARGLLTMVTAVLVVMVAAFGFYGAQRYLVAAGRREYAIRAAVGAAPGAVGRLVLLRALQISLPGVALGGLLAFIVAAYLRGDYVSPEVSSGVVTLLVIAGLASIVLVASIGPAREARRTQPAPLLRED